MVRMRGVSGALVGAVGWALILAASGTGCAREGVQPGAGVDQPAGTAAGQRGQATTLVAGTAEGLEAGASSVAPEAGAAGPGGALAPLLQEGVMDLPPPSLDGLASLESALAARRSVRDFADRPLTAAELSQLLWSAQGVTSDDNRRAAPSAGALYPLETYVATAQAVARYVPDQHRLRLHRAGDARVQLARAALDQHSVAEAPAVFVFTAFVARTSAKYGARAERYVWLEAGHAAQNLLLQAVALGLGGVPIGAFTDEMLHQGLGLEADETVLYLVPVGEPR